MIGLARTSLSSYGELRIIDCTYDGSPSPSLAVHPLAATIATLRSRGNLRFIQLDQVTISREVQHIPDVTGIELRA